jgi:hypothetical protein
MNNKFHDSNVLNLAEIDLVYPDSSELKILFTHQKDPNDEILALKLKTMDIIKIM